MLANNKIEVPILKGPSEEMVSLVAEAICESRKLDYGPPFYASKLLKFQIPGKRFLPFCRRITFNGQINSIEKTNGGEWKIRGEFSPKRKYVVRTSSDVEYVIPEGKKIEYEMTYQYHPDKLSGNNIVTMYV